MIAVLGLSGNPPHKGHLDLIKQAIEAHSDISKVLIVPCIKHPWGKTLNDIDAILKMNSAFAKDAEKILGVTCEMSDIEKSVCQDYKVEIAYSAEVLRWVKEKYNTPVCMIFGPDNEAGFDKFYQHQYITDNATVFFGTQKKNIRSSLLRPSIEGGDWSFAEEALTERVLFIIKENPEYYISKEKQA